MPMRREDNGQESFVVPSLLYSQPRNVMEGPHDSLYQYQKAESIEVLQKLCMNTDGVAYCTINLRVSWG
jgi:hypothetical protein